MCTASSKTFEQQSFLDSSSSGHDLDSNRKEFSYFGSQDWMMDYGKQELGIQYEKAEQTNTMNFDFLGILAHSWFDCISSLRIHWIECIHIIQVREKLIDSMWKPRRTGA